MVQIEVEQIFLAKLNTNSRMSLQITVPRSIVIVHGLKKNDWVELAFIKRRPRG